LVSFQRQRSNLFCAGFKQLFWPARENRRKPGEEKNRRHDFRSSGYVLINNIMAQEDC